MFNGSIFVYVSMADSATMNLKLEAQIALRLGSNHLPKQIRRK